MVEYKEKSLNSKTKLFIFESKTIKNIFFKISNILIAIIIPILFLLLWQHFGNTGVIKQSILPKPTRIWSSFIDLIITGNLWKNVSITLIRVIEGYLFGAVLGIVIGIAMGLFKILDRLLCVFTGLIRPIPMIAWIPVLILWLGMDETSKITVIALGTFWPVWLNVLSGIKNTDIKYIEIGKVFKKSKFMVLIDIILPAAMPSIFNGLRVGIGIAWSSVITAELISGTVGLGFMIQYARELIQPDIMLSGVFIIGIIGFLFDVLLKTSERWLLRWNTSLGSK
ncbi:MAG: ABC transporter permease [Clostridium sp.]|uniref:ABC transporter permease n=1 Tax=Clostridium sp. TaxID=1506 RepID=UPI0039EACF4D